MQDSVKSAQIVDVLLLLMLLTFRLMLSSLGEDVAEQETLDTADRGLIDAAVVVVVVVVVVVEDGVGGSGGGCVYVVDAVG